MKNPLHSLIHILDRPPGSTRGQSLVELTLTLPILLLMLLGMVEIGWLANNYLTLVDVSREAGRYGANRSPLTWPQDQERNYERLDCDQVTGQFKKFPEDDTSGYPGRSLPGYQFGSDDTIGFFDGVACSVIVNMQPLQFNDETDDIAVSVVTYTVVNNEAVITGRFPSTLNECGDDARDPFAPPFLTSADRDPIRFDGGTDGVRGFVFRGNHQEDGCIGSEFNLTELEEVLNETAIFDDNRAIGAEEIEQIPSNAFILVEIFWQHEQLLGLPFFTVIADPIELYVWSLFPVTSAEPTPTPIR